MAACGLPYVLSGDVDEVDALRRTEDGSLRDEAYFSAVKGVTVLAGREVIDVDPAQPGRRACEPAAPRSSHWDELVLATGARARKLSGQPEHARVCTLPHAGATSRGPPRARRRRDSHGWSIGGGLVGCELAEAFRSLWGCEVTLVEAAVTSLPGVVDDETAEVVARAMARHGVCVKVGCQVDAIEASDSGAGARIGTDRAEADVAVVAVGVDPAVGLAAPRGARLGATGAIAVDARLATSVPGVWAAGDCVEVRHAVTGDGRFLPLGSLANRQGRCLANVLAGRADRFPPWPEPSP